MKKVKLVFSVAFVVLILCSCSQEETHNTSIFEDLSSSETSVESPWETVTDFSGEKINYNDDVISFEVDYAICWNLLSEDYVKLDSNNKWLGYNVSASSTFGVIRYQNDFAVCHHSGLSLYLGDREEAKGFPGVFVLEEDSYGEKALNFYPYYGEENAGAFCFMHERTESAEIRLREKEFFTFSDGTKVKVQPIGIKCRYYDQNWSQITIETLKQLEEYMELSFDDDFEYVEATVYFSNFYFEGCSDANDTPAFKTKAWGTVDRIEMS